MDVILDILLIVLFLIVIKAVIKRSRYRNLLIKVLKELEISEEGIKSRVDEKVRVDNFEAFKKYDQIEFLKEDVERFSRSQSVIWEKSLILEKIKNFLENNDYVNDRSYKKLAKNFNSLLEIGQYIKLRLVV